MYLETSKSHPTQTQAFFEILIVFVPSVLLGIFKIRSILQIHYHSIMEAENNEVTVRERIVCVPSFLEDIRENVHLILGSKQMILHHEELMVFAQMLIVKYGREVCLTCPAFHVICGSTTPQNYH